MAGNNDARVARLESCSLGRQSALAGEAKELRQPPHLRSRARVAEWCEAVVASPGVVTRGAAPGDLADEALVDHAGDGPVERARAHAQLAAGPRLHVLNDRVAVPVLVEEREQNVKRRRREWEQLRDRIAC